MMTTDWKKAAEDAWDSPSWREAAEQYRRDRAGRVLIVEIPPEHLARLRRLMMRDEISLDRAWGEINLAAASDSMKRLKPLMTQLFMNCALMGFRS